MKIKVAIVAVLVSAMSWCYADATIRVAKLRVEPISPWGKIYMEFDIENTLPQNANEYMLHVRLQDLVSGREYLATTLNGDLALKAGKHKVLWDCSAEGLSVRLKNCAISVAYEVVYYCVVDLSPGASATKYSVEYPVVAPEGGFNADIYKTTKLVLRKIESGRFKTGRPQRVQEISTPFFMGLFEITQEQWRLVMGSAPSMFDGNPKHPVERVSYTMICGSPWSSQDAYFLGRLRSRTGLDFNLPNQSQWEYACRAGTTTEFWFGNVARDGYMWSAENSNSTTQDVGVTTPNPWGLYDMYGNVWELCEDIVISTGGDTYRRVCGGSWINESDGCSSTSVARSSGDYGTSKYEGFRVVCDLP